MKDAALQFCTSLDNDEYKKTIQLLTENCEYDIGTKVIKGAQAIVDSYEQNMLAGRKKMDKLEWGQSIVEEVNANEFIVSFTDYLYHKDEQYTFGCQQRLFTNSVGKIYKIEHIHDETAWQRLQDWYRSVGIPTSK